MLCKSAAIGLEFTAPRKLVYRYPECWESNGQRHRPSHVSFLSCLSCSCLSHVLCDEASMVSMCVLFLLFSPRSAGKVDKYWGHDRVHGNGPILAPRHVPELWMRCCRRMIRRLLMFSCVLRKGGCGGLGNVIAMPAFAFALAH